MTRSPLVWQYSDRILDRSRNTLVISIQSQVHFEYPVEFHPAYSNHTLWCLVDRPRKKTIGLAFSMTVPVMSESRVGNLDKSVAGCRHFDQLLMMMFPINKWPSIEIFWLQEKTCFPCLNCWNAADQQRVTWLTTTTATSKVVEGGWCNRYLVSEPVQVPANSYITGSR